MQTQIYKQIIRQAIIILILFVSACANRGIGPQGGPKDETPPQIVKEIPENGTVNFQDKRIELLFNEYVQLDKVSENVVRSPPQQRPPEVKALGNKVFVTFDEDLRDSTTYTIDFGSAICDNNEKNPMKDYSFSFATGDVIDSIEVSGLLLNAEDLNPISGIVVGIHRNPDDSALLRIPFTRIAKTNERGEFTIKNVHPGTYRIYALNDISKDYVYQPGEGLALYDSLINPSCHTELTLDTLWKDSLTIDTVKQVTEMLCEPNDLVLMFFKENKQRRYFQRLTREERHFFTLTFAAPQDSLPKLRLLDAADVIKQEQTPQSSDSGKKKSKKKRKKADDTLPVDTIKADSIIAEHIIPDSVGKMYSDSLLADSLHVMPDSISRVTTDTTAHTVEPVTYTYGLGTAAFCQVNPTHDTITYWLTDSSLIMQDTLIFEMVYQKTDSLYELQWEKDTIRALYRAPRISEKARERMEKNKEKPVVNFTTNARSPFEIYSQLTINTSTPLRLIENDSIHLYQMIDTIPKLIPAQLVPADSSYMHWLIRHDWLPDTSYRLTIDSAAVCDIYGSVNNAYKSDFKTRTLDEYSSLIIKIEPFDQRGMIQIVDDKDTPIRTARAQQDGVKFEYLSPKSYYVRMYLDINGDSVWTTGDYQTHRQPEPVYYFSSKLTLRANWDFEETFNYLELPQEEQKPRDITKDAAKKK